MEDFSSVTVSMFFYCLFVARQPFSLLTGPEFDSRFVLLTSKMSIKTISPGKYCTIYVCTLCTSCKSKDKIIYNIQRIENLVVGSLEDDDTTSSLLNPSPNKKKSNY